MVAEVDAEAIRRTRGSLGLHISYEDRGGDEPALLFMAGWCSDRGVFAGLTERTARNCRSLALDWRGHGASEAPGADFGAEGLVEDALAVIAASQAQQVVPVALAHAGWVAIELRRRLGPTRVPKLVLIDWIVLDPPPLFLEALGGLQDPARWEATWSGLRAMWSDGVENPALAAYLKDVMGSYDQAMVGRAGREVAAAYASEGTPLSALARLEPHAPTLHLYAQPADPGYLAAQQAFAAEHPWFQVQRLDARSHFPMFEVPHEMATAIERFVAGSTSDAPPRAG